MTIAQAGTVRRDMIMIVRVMGTGMMVVPVMAARAGLVTIGTVTAIVAAIVPGTDPQ